MAAGVRARALAGLLAASLLCLLAPHTAASEFNFEISRRVHEKLSHYMNDPQLIARIISEYRTNHGFAHDMAAPDRNAYMRLNDAMMTLYPHFESIYYGLEVSSLTLPCIAM